MQSSSKMKGIWSLDAMVSAELSSRAIRHIGDVQSCHCREELLIGSYQLGVVEFERSDKALELNQGRNTELGVGHFLNSAMYGFVERAMFFDQVDDQARIEVDLGCF